MSNNATEKALQALDHLAALAAALIGPLQRGLPEAAEALPPDSEMAQICMLGARAGATTVEKTGDGSAVTALLIRALYAEALNARSRGHNAESVKLGIEKAADAMNRVLWEMSQQVADRADCVRKALTMSGFDPDSPFGSDLARILAGSLGQSTPPELVIGDASELGESRSRHVSVFKFEQGYLSPYFATFVDEKGAVAVLEKPLILLCDGVLATAADADAALALAHGRTNPLLILAEDATGEALASFVAAKLRGAPRVCVAKEPGHASERRANLGDIAVATSARVISLEQKNALTSAKPADLGSAIRVVASRDATRIIGGKPPTAEATEKRIDEINAAIDTERSDYYRGKLVNRIMALTESCLLLEFDSEIPAAQIPSTRAIRDIFILANAIEAHGTVPGGGVALVRAVQGMQAEKLTNGEKAGWEALSKAAEAPARRIAANGGFDPDWALEATKSGGADFGLDAISGRHCKLYDAGVIDAAEVMRAAVKNATSFVGQLLDEDPTFKIFPKRDAAPPAPVKQATKPLIRKEEQRDGAYSVMLIAFDEERKMTLNKAMAELTGTPVLESMAKLKTPSEVTRASSEAIAKNIKIKLEKLGARIEIRKR